jgi:hypothetical protein
MTSSDRRLPPPSLLQRLSPSDRDRLIEIGEQSSTAFGPLPIQALFDRQLSFIESLVDAGATAAMLCRLLAEVGVTRVDGSKLTEGTISSALSRARARLQPGPVVSLASPLALAGSCRDPQEPAGSCSAMPHPSTRASPQISSIGPPPAGTPAPLAPNTRRSAALLEFIRSQDES